MTICLLNFYLHAPGKIEGNIHTPAQRHARRYLQSHAGIHSHTDTHIYTHTHARTHMHTHTHTKHTYTHSERERERGREKRERERERERETERDRGTHTHTYTSSHVHAIHTCMHALQITQMVDMHTNLRPGLYIIGRWMSQYTWDRLSACLMDVQGCTCAACVYMCAATRWRGGHRHVCTCVRPHVGEGVIGTCVHVCGHTLERGSSARVYMCAATRWRGGQMSNS
jgi:hypothetical protein